MSEMGHMKRMKRMIEVKHMEVISTLLKVFSEKISRLEKELEEEEGEATVLEERIGKVLCVISDFAETNQSMTKKESDFMDKLIFAICNSEKEAKAWSRSRLGQHSNT